MGRYSIGDNEIIILQIFALLILFYINFKFNLFNNNYFNYNNYLI